MALGEGMTRTGFQVGLEAHRERLGSEFDAHVDGPRAPRGGRAILAGVVRGQPGDEVARDADVSAPRIVAAAEDVDEALLRTRHARTSAGSRPMARCRHVGSASEQRAAACRICKCANRPPSPRTLASTSARRSLRSQRRWASRSLASEGNLREQCQGRGLPTGATSAASAWRRLAERVGFGLRPPVANKELTGF